MLDLCYSASECHRCGAHNSPENKLYHDGKSFIVCVDSGACLARVERHELAEYFALQTMAKNLRCELSTVLKRQGELEVKLGLYDVALEEHRAEMAKIEGEGEREKAC